MHAQLAIVLFAALTNTQPALQGLSGLGAPGGLLKAADPKTAAFEADVLAALNGGRAVALTMDERLRTFARHEAELGAKGSPEAKTVVDRIKQQGLAPYGHRLQYAFGADAKTAVANLLKDAGFAAAVKGEFARAGVGAFYVPEAKPYFQVCVLLIADADPLAGKPGLSPADTDPVMASSSERIKICYDEALKRDPNAGGDVVLQLVIGAKGTVDSTKALKSFGDGIFDRCAIAVVNTLKFPAPYKGKAVTLNHPLRFTPPQGQKRVGRLSPSQQQSAFSQASYDFKVCFDTRAKELPNLHGTITLGLTVNEYGAITNLEVVGDEPKDPGLTECVRKRAQTVRFPQPEFGAPTNFTYPLRFESGAAKSSK